jgi:glycerol-3-phosphate dehydrogenase
MVERWDVVIIGGGVTGCAIARELSRYRLKIALVEAAEDVAMGASRANSAIVHAGYDAEPGTLMAELNVKGNALYDEWCAQLHVPLQRIGSLVIGFDASDRQEIEKLYQRGIQNGVPGLRIISGDEARKMEPRLNEKVTCALHAETGAITCPYEMTIACAENARKNGVTFVMDAPVQSVEHGEEGDFVLRAGDETLKARYLINAAGLHADDVARMIGDDSFSIFPRKGEYMLLDKSAGGFKKVIFQTPSRLGKGVLVSPTVDGNAFAGPTAVNTQSKSDNEVTDEGIAQLNELSRKSVPSINLRAVITSFAGVRAQPSTGDFIIRPSEQAPHFIHAAGICSPGLTSAPAIAQRVAELLKQQGLKMEEKADFDPVRMPIPAFRHMNEQERIRAIQQNPAYGRIICRCETITEGEIVEAIHRGARSLDGVKRRTRAGMGRCQGGFCGPRVMELLSRELNMPMERLTKFGGGSNLLVGKLKEDE